MFWGSGSVETTYLRAGTQSLKEIFPKKNINVGGIIIVDIDRSDILI